MAMIIHLHLLFINFTSTSVERLHRKVDCFDSLGREEITTSLGSHENMRFGHQVKIMSSAFAMLKEPFPS